MKSIIKAGEFQKLLPYLLKVPSFEKRKVLKNKSSLNPQLPDKIEITEVEVYHLLYDRKENKLWIELPYSNVEEFKK